MINNLVEPRPITYMPEKKKNEYTTKYSDFDAERLTFTDLEENERSKGQLIAYPRYNHPTLGEDKPLFIQGPWMKLFTYGIPSLGEYYADDSQRGFVKVALDFSDPEVKKMVDEFIKLDEELGSDEFMQKAFGKKASKYKYQPVIRIPEEDDEGNTKSPYMKLKLDTSWPDGNVLTQLFKSELVDGKRVREKVEVSTVTEVAKHLSYMTKYRPVFRPVKMWGHNSKMPKPEYGVVFKLLKAEFEPNSNGSSSYQDYLDGDAFIDDDDDEVETTDPVKSEPETVFTTTKKSSKAVELDDDDDDSDNDSDESSEDSDSEEVKKPVKKAAVKGKSKSNGK